MKISRLREQLATGEIAKGEFIKEAFDVHLSMFDLSALLKTSIFSKVEIREDSIAYTLRKPDVTFVVSKPDPRIAPIEALNFGNYEESINFILHYVLQTHSKNNQIMLDVGANIGWYSLQMAKLFPDAKIHAFEPQKHCAGMLSRNCLENNLKNVTLVPKAVSETAGKLYMTGQSETSVAAHIKLKADKPEDQDNSVQSVPLDHYCQELSLQPALIKADVEGAEIFVIKSASNVLKKYKPACVLEILRKWCARFSYHPNDCIQFMKEHDYLCFAIGDNSCRRITEVNEDTIETNYLFLNPEKHSEMIGNIDQGLSFEKWS